MCWTEYESPGDWGDLVNGDHERDLGSHGKVVRCGGTTNNVKRQIEVRSRVSANSETDARQAESKGSESRPEAGAGEPGREPGTREVKYGEAA